jgi:hypothetical protein
MAGSLQQLVQEMLDKVKPMLNTPGNAYYLPTWVVQNQYDPYGKTQAMQWSVTLSDPSIIQTAASICPTLDITDSPCGDTSSFIGAPNNNPTLVLGTGQPGGLLVSGCSNAYMPSMLADAADPYNIVAVVQLSTLPNFAKNVQITGQFVFTQFCCCSADGKTCNNAPSPHVGKGTFSAIVNGSPSITVNFRIVDLRPGVLTIGVQTVTFAVPTKGGAYDISVTVDIQSIPLGANRQSYNNMAQNAFNSPSGLTNIVQQINAVMNDPSQKAFMGKVLTGVIDGYLRDNHQYPFDGSTLAVF